MKLIIKYSLSVIIALFLSINLFSQYITLEGKQFKLDGNNFYPVMCNYIINLCYEEGNPDNFVMCPHHNYGENSLDNFIPMSAALDRLFNDFNQIKQMGFNTVRLMPLIDKFRNEDGIPPNKGYLGGFYSWQINYRDEWNDTTLWHQYHFSSPYIYNQNLESLLDQYLLVLEKAKLANLKVIIVIGRGQDLFKDQTEVDDYTELVQYFAMRLKNSTALMAYDIFNEPGVFEPWDHKKAQICNWTTQIYDAIKSEDSSHLITVGGHCVLDAFEWDPSVVKQDFWSPHLYPKFDPRIPPSNDKFIMEFSDQVYWTTQNCPIPWMIGEAGYVANDTVAIENCWGTEADQADFADQTLSIVHDGNGSGYASWMFQYVNWSALPPIQDNGPVQNHYTGTDDYYRDVTKYYQNNFGLMQVGDPINCNANSGNCDYSALEKPIVDIFQNYLDQNNQPPSPGPPILPSDDYGKTGINPNHPNKIWGKVVDHNGVPIKDAVIQGWNYLALLEFDDPKKDDENYHIYEHAYNTQYTFTDEFGYFEMIPYDYIRGIEYPYPFNGPGFGLEYFNGLKIACIGGEELFVNGWIKEVDTLNPLFQLQNIVIDHPHGNLGTFVINRNPIMYDEHISGITVDIAPPSHRYSGWNSLTLTNIMVNGNGTMGGIADFSARSEVMVNPEFTAALGCEVNLFCSNVFRDCESINMFKSVEKLTYENIGRNSDGDELELTFITSLLEISIYPNPAETMVTIKLPESMNTSVTKAKFLTISGSLIAEFDFVNDYNFYISQYPKGVYLLNINNDKINITKKIVLI